LIAVGLLPFVEFVPTGDHVSVFVPSGDYVGPAPSAIGPSFSKEDRPSDDRSLFERQLRVIREMIEDMQPQTIAGQRHTMEKVVAFLRAHVRPGALSVTLWNGRQLSQMVDQLQREAERQVPDVRLFADRAEALVVLLSVAA
jgi:hypothetical protein